MAAAGFLFSLSRISVAFRARNVSETFVMSVLIIASLANMFFAVPAASLAISAVAILIFSGYILFDVSRIVQGGETNYVMATVSLFVSLFNLFTSLLSLFGWSGGKD